MIINRAALNAQFTGFKSIFNEAFTAAAPDWQRVAMMVPSTTTQEQYGWLGQVPGLREWVGDRVVQNLQTYDFTLKNRDYEATIGVGRNDIEDDRIGIYRPMIAELGRAASVHPDELVFGLIKTGFSALCYDGKPFFSDQHPYTKADGKAGTQSNTGGGSGTAWFLLDTARMIKPLIFQRRRPYTFVRMDAETDEEVFNRKTYRYGVDARVSAGFGLWQLAHGSKQTLDAAGLKAAYQAMEELKGDHGRPLGLKPNLLVVPPALREAGLELLSAERNAAGATNVWRGTATLLVSPWLA